MISPQTNAKVVGGDGTTVDIMLAMASADPPLDDDLCRVLNSHEIVLGNEWSDVK